MANFLDSDTSIMNEMPDPDAIKMFVGQIPKQWIENDVRLYFEEFGRIYLVNVLRDKITKQSRGCCFITYYTRKSALDAQNACHNVRILTGMNHPIQMKPADNENRHERKIFVGMLSKIINEAELRLLFVRFGLIEETSILRDANGNSRGCGFVTFSSKASALNAIKTMHQSTLMDGCSSPLVVKIADTQKDKFPKILTNCLNPGGINALNFNDCATAIAQNAQYLTLLQLLQQQVQLPCANPGNSTGSLSTNSMNANDLTSGINLLPNPINPSQGILNKNLQSILQNTGNSLLGISPICNGQNAGSNPASYNPLSSTAQFQFASASTGINQPAQVKQVPAQVEGPEGSNLFIYHLPQDFTDTDLIQSFLPFGTILSAKVFIDKSTNLSKCFGFVSYDNSLSAQLAIQTMNGFQIGSKRLKVQLKRPKDKPY